MPYKEFEIKKLYFPISEVCEYVNSRIDSTKPHSKLTPGRLRTWEKIVPIVSPSRVNGKGDRKYNEDKMNDILLFTELMNTGYYTIRGAGMKLKQIKNDDKVNTSP